MARRVLSILNRGVKVVINWAIMAGWKVEGKSERLIPENFRISSRFGVNVARRVSTPEVKIKKSSTTVCCPLKAIQLLYCNHELG